MSIELHPSYTTNSHSLTTQHHVFPGTDPKKALGGAFRREGEGVEQEDPQGQESGPRHGQQQRLHASPRAHKHDQVSAAEEFHPGKKLKFHWAASPIMFDSENTG